jgi:hypothetical protein
MVIQLQPAPSDFVSVAAHVAAARQADRLHEPQTFWAQAGGSRKDGDGEGDGDGDDYSMRRVEPGTSISFPQVL